nr:MAG TPA: hypothetical protein [Caudoviricetes sp.]
MISIDLGNVKINGSRMLVKAELATLLKVCKDVMGEEDYKYCIEKAETSTEEICKDIDKEIGKDARMNLEKIIRIILGIKEDK